MSRTISSRSILVLFCALSVLSTSYVRASITSLREGLLVEADVQLGEKNLAGRVLVEAGREAWTTVATKPATQTEPELKFQIRANLVDADVAQVEARLIGKDEQSTAIVIRLGDRGTISQNQIEDSSAGTQRLKVEVKVLRVRYSL